MNLNLVLFRVIFDIPLSSKSQEMTLISVFQILSGPVLYCILNCFVPISLYEINYCLNKLKDSNMYKL